MGLALFCSLFRKGLFLLGTLLFPVLFTASAAFAAEPFCDSQLDDLRWRCVQEVKKTNGGITFKDTLREHDNGGFE